MIVMKKSVKKFFPQEDLQAIADAIGEAEKTTLGEIRVDIRQRRNWLETKTFDRSDGTPRIS